MTQVKTKKIYRAKVSEIKQVSINSHFIEIECEVPVEIKAGQFVSIYCEGLTFRRPFSVYSNNNGKIGVLFKERGKGTEYIKSLTVGSSIDIMGPVGNSFDIQNKKSLLVGAGIGTAPISFLKSKLDEKGIENIFLAGFLNKNEIPELCINSDNAQIYTDDGSAGIKGHVLVNIEQVIHDFKPEIIYACGPHIVLKNIVSVAKKHNIKVQVAMEKVMACGIGVCRGCVIDVIRNGVVANATVCKDGPVFDGSEVVW